MDEPGTFARKSKVLFWQLLLGFILGVLFWELVGQWWLAKKYGSFGSSVTCAPDVQRALADFDSGLRRSALAGAGLLVAAVFGIKLWWRRRKRVPSGTSPTSPNPPSSTGGAVP